MPSPEDAAVLKAYFDGVDHERWEAEKKWGAGRLELLVDDLTRARFARQRVTWVEALRTAWEAPFVTRDHLALVGQKAAAMRRGFAAMDAIAEEAGHRAIAPWVWEAPLADGSVAAFVQSQAEVGRVIAQGRHLYVFTVAEVGYLIDKLPEVLCQAKVHFPGAKFEASVVNNLGAPPWSDRGDDIPF
jgi:hypothetical protein